MGVKMTNTDLGREIYRISHLKGRFQLRSGLESNEYFDKYKFESNPKTLKKIAKEMSSLIPQQTEVLAGLELGGIPLVTALSLETGLPSAFIRKEAKTYGTCLLAEGCNIKDKNVCVIEDVITTGGQVLESTSELRQLGAKIDTILCVIFRGTDLTKFNMANLVLHCLFKMEELKKYEI